MIDLDRLKANLLTSGLQKQNAALYQVINQLINSFKEFQEIITNISGGDTINTNTTEVTNIIQFLNSSDGDGGDSGSDTIPGPPGIAGSAGATGSPGAVGPSGAVILPEDGQDGEYFPPIQGPQGNQGVQGLTGDSGPVGPMLLADDGLEGESGISIIGPKGDTGNTGATGAQGPVGPVLLVEDGLPGDDGISRFVTHIGILSRGITIYGTITTGFKGVIRIPQNCTILGWTVMSDIPGSIEFDILVDDPSITYPPTTSIVASTPPELVSDDFNDDTVLSGWTPNISAGDVMGFEVISVSGSMGRVTLQLDFAA